jgi:Zn-dependent peptidase ImmA (M78 family)
MNNLVMTALRKAGDIRRKHKFTAYQPLNVFDLCFDMDITVRFVEINMEGMYFSQQDGSSPQIWISNQRPLPRRVFTCAHELGHHLFGHGSKVDGLTEGASSKYDGNEFLVDTFAGALLMPVTAVLAEFAKRDWNINSSTPEQFQLIASIFGTGYSTLVVHCQKNKILTDTRAKTLLKVTPGKILSNILGTGKANSHFKIFDELNSSQVVDLEVGNFIILPSSVTVEGTRLRKSMTTSSGVVYIAEKPGIDRVIGTKKDESYFIRIQNAAYIGLAEYRHLEN